MKRAFAAVALVTACSYPRTPGASPSLVFVVAPDGNDAWPGSADRPFATLERARDAARALGSHGQVTVELRSGRYPRTAPFVVGHDDSGVTYRARGGEVVEIDGGVVVDVTHGVTDPTVLARLDPSARGHVVAASLGSIDPGSVEGHGLELVFDHQPMTLARWPNTGFVTIAGVMAGDPIDILGRRGDRSGKLVYEGDRPSRWVEEPAPWVHGYWFWDWSDQREPIAAIDPAHHVLALGPPLHHYGYRAGQWYYAFNLLSELDAPGEWYVDRAARVMYFWPPRAAGTAEVSVADQLLVVDGAHDVAFEGLTFENVRGDAITIRGSQRVALADLTVRDAGGWGVTITGGDHDTVDRSEIAEVGEGGIRLDGGDRRTLVAGHHRASNNHIHDYSRWRRTAQAAVEIRGVGQEVSGNHIHDAPNVAIDFGGNDHVIERNLIERVCQESNDAGAIAAGRDWTMRGTVIRNNILRDLHGLRGAGCNGVMLDDLFSGTEVTGNIFERVQLGILVGGGRDNVIDHNVFESCPTAIRLDARGLGWAAYSIDESMRPSLDAMPYQTPPWSTRYPRLARILADEPAAPKGNRIAHNIAVEGALVDIDPKFRDLEEIVGNIGGAAR